MADDDVNRLEAAVPRGRMQRTGVPAADAR